MDQNQARGAPLRAGPRPKHATVWARVPTWSTLGLAVAVPAVALIAFAAPLLHGSAQHPRPVAAQQHRAAGPAQQQSQASTSAPLPPAPLDLGVPAVAVPVATAMPTGRFAGNANPPEQVAAVSPLAADGIPRTALEAYENAAQRANLVYSGCHIPWPLLAGIGRVESDHGRYGGAVLYSNGTSSSKILGIPLDGSRSARITDTDNGKLDGDRVYDRAVGPMQFIPSTWQSYGVDGNGDGVVDPFNIYDAAAAAADYLCTAGGDLGTQHGQERAVLAYNHSSAYLSEVLGLERTYAAGVGLIVPVGPAPPKPPNKTPHVPPVDPGPPLGHRPHGPHSPQHSHHPTKHPSSPAPSTSTSSSPSDPTSSSSSAAPSTSASSSSCPTPTTTASTSSGRTGSPRLPHGSDSSSPDAPVTAVAPSGSATDAAKTDSSSANTSASSAGSTSAKPTC